VVGSLGVAAFGQLVLMGTGIAVARMLGVENRGDLALFAVLVAILVLLGGLGLPVGVTFFLARGASLSDLVRVLRPVLIAQFALLTPVHAALLVALFHDAQPSVRHAALLSLPALPASLLQSYGIAILQGQQRFRSLNLARMLPAVGYGIAVALAFAAGWNTLIELTAAWSLAAVVVALLILGTAVTRRELAGPGRDVMRRDVLSFGLKGLLGSTSPLEAFRLDQAVTGLLLSSRLLGIYVVGMAFTNLPRFVGQSLGYIAYPVAAGRDSRSETWRTIGRFTLAGTVLTLVVVAVLEVLAGHIVPFFFGSEFSPAIPVTRLLLIGAFFASLRKLLADCAQGAGYPAFGSIAEIVSWTVLVPSLAVLTPRYGVEGIALSMALAYATSFVGLGAQLVLARRRELTPNARSRFARAFTTARSAMGAPIVVALVAIAAAWSLVALRPPGGSFLLVYLGGLLALVPVMLVVMGRRFDIFEPVYLFAIAYAVLFVVRPAVDLSAQGGVPAVAGVRVDATYERALVVAVVGCLAFYVGYFGRLGVRLSEAVPLPPQRWPSGTVRGLVVTTGVIVAAVFGAFVLRHGGLNALSVLGGTRSVLRTNLFASSSAYAYAAPFWLIAIGVLLVALADRWRSSSAVLGLVLVGSSQVFALGSGDRSWILPPIAALVLVGYLKRGRRPRVLTAVLTLAAVFVVGVAAPSAYRNATNYESASKAATSVVTSPGNGVGRFFTSGDTAMAPDLAAELGIVPHTVQYRYGATLLGDLARPLPRSVWPGKPREAETQLMARLWPGLYRQNVQFTFSIFGEPFWNFGLIGVVIACWLFGLSWRALYSWYQRAPGNRTAIALYALSWPFMFVYMRGGIGLDYQRHVIAVAPILIGLAVIRGHRPVVPARKPASAVLRPRPRLAGGPEQSR
jgi:O-antigen/teichoic acid export membrane protein